MVKQIESNHQEKIQSKDDAKDGCEAARSEEARCVTGEAHSSPTVNGPKESGARATATKELPSCRKVEGTFRHTLGGPEIP